VSLGAFIFYLHLISFAVMNLLFRFYPVIHCQTIPCTPKTYRFRFSSWLTYIRAFFCIVSGGYFRYEGHVCLFHNCIKLHA
jgi:hypothetical protein